MSWSKTCKGGADHPDVWKLLGDIDSGVGRSCVEKDHFPERCKGFENLFEVFFAVFSKDGDADILKDHVFSYIVLETLA